MCCGTELLGVSNRGWTTNVFGLEGLSPIEVWDVLDGWTYDGHGTV